MAKAEHQRAWRQRSGKKPIQCYMDVDTIARLDALAGERGQSRADVLAELIDAAAPATEGGADARDADTRDMFEVEPVNTPVDTTEATQAAQEPSADPAPEGDPAAPSGAEVPTHKLRKAHGEAPDGSDAWAVYVESARVGLAYRNTNPNEQRAPSVAWIAVCERDATRKRYRYRTRTQAVEMMLRVERPHERRR